MTHISTELKLTLYRQNALCTSSYLYLLHSRPIFAKEVIHIHIWFPAFVNSSTVCITEDGYQGIIISSFIYLF